MKKRVFKRNLRLASGIYLRFQRSLQCLQ